MSTPEDIEIGQKMVTLRNQKKTFETVTITSL